MVKIDGVDIVDTSLVDTPFQVQNRTSWHANFDVSLRSNYAADKRVGKTAIRK